MAITIIATIMEETTLFVFLLLKLNIVIYLFPERTRIMPIPFILIFAILCLVLMHNLRRSRRIAEKRSAQFWANEAAANETRRQDISQLDYIYIPLELLPFGTDRSDSSRHCEDILHDLDSKKILNLNAYTNTDLKLQYGVANLAFLSECDERFLLLIRTLYQWACILLEDGYTKEAIQVAEYSIEIGSDISGCYYMLADYYRALGDDAALDALRKSAEAITGLQADSIKEYLNKSQES